MVAFHILMWHESVMFRESLNCYGTLTVLEPLCATPGLQCNEACDAIATEGEMPLTTTQHTHTHTHTNTHTHKTNTPTQQPPSTSHTHTHTDPNTHTHTTHTHTHTLPHISGLTIQKCGGVCVCV